MLLEPPPLFGASFVLALALVLGFGTVSSSPRVWFRWFPKRDAKGENPPPSQLSYPVLLSAPDRTKVSAAVSQAAGYTTYLKSGEYGESEAFPHAWSPFVEPLNAWTSLAYSLFGLVVLLTGLYDWYALQTDAGVGGSGSGSAPNLVAANPLFSLLYGASTVYLGAASFLFHASHSETWRKADAGMTSGCVVTPLLLALYDRARPPLLSGGAMVALALLLQTSLTHGHLPYGSSDVLLPTLVGLCWLLELTPRYGGPVDGGQWGLWGQCCFACIGGMLLRLSDIKRGGGTFTGAMRLYALLCCITATLLGPHPLVLVGLCAGVCVYLQPSRGHIFWHFGSAYSLFIWWYQYRVRPGDPAVSSGADWVFWCVVLAAAVKNACRRLLMVTPMGTQEMRDRAMFLLEHTLFGAWCYHCIVVEAEAAEPGSSWLLHLRNCWRIDGPSSASFALLYLARTGASVEDALYMAAVARGGSGAGSGSSGSGGVGGSSASISISSGSGSGNGSGSGTDDPAPHDTPASASRDTSMVVHHAATALLCLSSCLSGYTRIGSLVMLLHDLSDIPLDAVRLVGLVRGAWAKRLQLLLFAATLAAWLYWRLLFFPSVLWSIAVESKSRMVASGCAAGKCGWTEVPERGPFLLLLGTLFGLNCWWFLLLLRKGYREVVGVEKKGGR